MKRNLLLLSLCLIAIIFLIHPFKRPAKSNPSKINDAAPSRSDSSVASVLLTNPVVQVIDVQTALPPVNVVMSDLKATNAAANDAKEQAEVEKWRLLRELRAWAAKDAEGALAAAMKLPEGDERNEALEAVCFGLAETDPADAVKTAKSLHLDNQPGAVLENLVQQWATSDTSSALDWANSQPAGASRDGLTTRIAYVMSQSYPAGAANLVLNQITPGSAQDEAIMTVLNQWANQNLVAATTWAKGLSTGPLQERAINELVEIQNRQQALAHQ